jgi:isoleucyl-tRNA synthetase
VLTNWYVRRSRERFWATGGVDQDARNAFDTLYTVLEVLTRVAAPLAPLVTEEIWRGLTGGRSVHLTDWPSADELPSDAALVAAMDAAREVASTTLGLRKAQGLRVRLPLAALTVVTTDPEALEPFRGLLADEVNVKTARLVGLEDTGGHHVGVTQRLTVNARAAGPRLGKQVQEVIRASKAGDWSLNADGLPVCAGIPLVEGEFTLETVVADGNSGEAVAVLPDGGFVILDTEVSPELNREGLARDLVRAVQQVRRDVGLAVGDRIRLTVAADGEAAAALAAFEALVSGETLAEQVATLAADAPSAADGTQTSLGDGSVVRILVEKV